MNEENKMTKLALGEQARPQPIRQGSQPAGKNKFKFFAPRNLARGQVSGGLEEAAWLGLAWNWKFWKHVSSQAPDICPARLQACVPQGSKSMCPASFQACSQ